MSVGRDGGKRLRDFKYWSPQPKRLSATFSRRLTAYAATAGAAGAGLLALSQPAAADIIYTPADITLRCCFNLQPIDLNHDGVTDFTFIMSQGNVSESWLNVRGYHGDKVMTSGARVYLYPGAALLQEGARIGSGAAFGRSGAMVGCYASHGPCVGNWATKEGYLGLELTVDGQVHFGWAALQVQSPGSGEYGQFSAELTGYAYETEADEAIGAGQTTDTPEPATLGLLALGTVGLGYWRRKKRPV